MSLGKSKLSIGIERNDTTQQMGKSLHISKLLARILCVPLWDKGTKWEVARKGQNANRHSGSETYSRETLQCVFGSLRNSKSLEIDKKLE